MSLSLSIPLSGFFNQFFSFYTQIDENNYTNNEDNDFYYRLVGYSSPRSAADTPTNYILALNIPVPLRRNSLESAVLRFPINGIFPIGSPSNTGQFQKVLPDYISSRPSLVDSSQTETLVVEDPRNIELNKSINDPYYISYATTRRTNILNNLNSILFAEYVDTQQAFISNNVQNTTLNITSLLSIHINTFNQSWKINNNIPIVISGVSIIGPAGAPPTIPFSGGVGAIKLSNMYLDLIYKPVPPEAPRISTVSQTSYKQASLNWQAPDDGGANISRYILQYAYGSGRSPVSDWISLSDSVTTSAVIDNLPLDSPLLFRVAAVNVAGTGVFSPLSDAITLSKNLGPVTSLTFNDINPVRLRVRRDVSNNWNTQNPILSIGEIAYESDSKRLKIGDGISFWSGLPYVTVDQNSINFPDPPDVFLRVASSASNEPNNDRIIVNLSQDERLNIVGEGGIELSYSNDSKRLSIKSDTLYNPILSGTIINPVSSGSAGSLLYDETWLYFCTNTNYWQRTPIDKTWINFSDMVISSSGNNLFSFSSLLFSQNTGIFFTDGDPYPALAGNPLTNTGNRNFSNLPTTILKQNKRYNFIYRGGQNSSNPMNINDPNEILGFLFNGATLKSFNLGVGRLVTNFPALPPGLTHNFDVQNKLRVYSDRCGGYPDTDSIYSYRDGSFLTRCWNDPLVYESNSYYNNTNYQNDHFRQSNGHSKMLGFCLDGYPIYGPYGYEDPLDSSSSVVLLKSSYSGLITDNHRPVDWKYDNTISVNTQTYTLLRGIFIEDFVYLENFGHLDQFNGRFAITPEFPNGTYAYYLTFTDDSLLESEFPYIIGPQTKQQRYNNV